MKQNTKVGFVGTGVMGGPMALNLIKTGFALTVFTRTNSKASEVIKAGARWANSAAEAARNADAVISIVGYPEDVREVYLGDDGILSNAKKGGVVIDMTTSEPSLAKSNGTS